MKAVGLQNSVSDWRPAVDFGVGTAAFEVVLKMTDSNIELAEEEN